MPRMDNKETSRRFPQPPASHPPPPQAAPDPSNPPNRPNTVGTEFGNPGGLSSARQLPRRQQPRPSQGIPGVHEFTQNPVPNDPRGADNAYATVRAGSGQHGHTGNAASTQIPQFGQDRGHGQAQSTFVGYSGPVSVLSPPTGSPQLPGTRSGGSGNPAGSVGSRLSHPGGEGAHRSPPNVPHAPGVAGHAHRTVPQQMGATIHAQGASDASPQSITSGPPYDAYVRPARANYPGFGGLTHGMTGDASQRSPMRRFATTGTIEGPLPPPSVLENPRHNEENVQFGTPNAPPAPQTPQLDLHTRQLSLEDNPVHFGGHPQQQPYGVPPPFQPPGPTTIGNLQRPHPELPLTHIEAASLGENLTLAMLSDNPIAGEKPNYPYPTLIRAAILGSPRRALTLQGIYRALEDRFEWFRTHKNDKAWQNSIRHNLSLNKLFRRLQKPITEPGKGSYWTVDFGAGEGNKRDRKRVKRGGRASDSPSTSRQGLEPSSEEESDNQSVGASQSQVQIPPPFTGFGRPMYEEPNINPALLQQGHFAGQGRMLPPRSPRLSPAPYSRSSLPAHGTAHGMQEPHVAALGQFSVRPGQTTTFGGQPALQGPPLDAWEASFMGGPPAPPAWGAEPPSPTTFDTPMATPSATPGADYEPPTPTHVTRGRPVRAMTTGSTPTEMPSAASTPGRQMTPIYAHSPAAISVEIVGSGPGTSSSSASEAGSIHSATGPNIAQAARRGSGSSSSSLSYE